MSSGLLPDHIGPLVDRLRKGDHQSVSLPDVAALTEVLMRSVESYFKSIDLTIYEECQSLADYIDDARQEISSLSPENNDTVGIPRAGLELEAIVQQTESATNSIMESAERIMEADTSDTTAYQNIVNDAVMQIFEACSFQDITGQRISKVVSTLEHVEDRVDRLINILGVMDKSSPQPETEPDEVDEDKALLNGPALEGEGIDQTEIDALLNDKVEDDIDFEVDDSETSIPDTTEAPQTTENVTASSEEETSSADDIDFMFDGQGQIDDDPQVKDSQAAPEVDITTEEDVAEEPAVTEAAPQPQPQPDPETEAPAEEIAEPNLIEQAKQRKAQARAEKLAQAKAPDPVVYEEDPDAALKPKVSENTTQSDIDALFS